jgi:hypothetical protein
LVQQKYPHAGAAFLKFRLLPIANYPAENPFF